jgi:hypothetical protein
VSLELYDKSMSDKLKALFPNTIMAPPEEALGRSNDDTADVKLPLVSVYRISNPINFEEYNRYEVFSGKVTRMSRQSEDIIRQQGLPITITYQIDIWASLRKDADGLYREIVFYLMTHPNLTIKMPNLEEPFNFSLKLTDVDTPTEYSSFSDTGTLHRYTLTYEIDNARLFFQSGVVDQIHQIDVEFINMEEEV